MSAQSSQMPFDAAAHRAVMRLALAAFLRTLRRTALPIFAVALAAWVLIRRAGMRDDGWWAFIVIALWLLGSAVWAWLRRPEPFAALAAWDHAAGQREMFASAWFFEKTCPTEPGAALHLHRARDALRQRGGFLRRDLPLRHDLRTWLAPLLFLVVALSGWLRAPIAPEDRALSAEARERAADVAKALIERTDTLKPLAALSAEEQEKIKGLRAELKQTAQDLKNTETPRDLLEKLERGASDTERLAETLGNDADSLSPGFLSELERNADTADLGNALRAQDLGRAAEEARLLEARLGRRKPTLEEQKRLEEALKRALEAANKRDRESSLGRRLAEAQRQLGAGNHGGAAGQFGALGEQLGRSAERRQTQQQLRGLAQQFRGAGQGILGGRNLQRLTPAPPGSQPLANVPLLAPGAGNLGQSPNGMMPMPGSGAPLAQIPVPGMSPGTPRGGMAFPIPGTGGTGQPQTGGIPLPIPGTGQPPAGSPSGVMAFPIPGSGPLAGAPIPGGASAAGNGGSQAGRGTAALGGDPTQPLAAAQTGVVAPAPGAEGPSERRVIAGGGHRESAARSRQELAIEFLKTEETALAEEPLPASRREQVLRYFTAVRQQLEKQP
jgi:hypothetical protein